MGRKDEWERVVASPQKRVNPKFARYETLEKLPGIRRKKGLKNVGFRSIWFPEWLGDMKWRLRRGKN